jgi:hypothetical protein
MIRFFEALVGVFLLLGVLPLVVVVLVAQAFTGTKPVLVVREVWEEGQSSQRLEFTRPPGQLGVFLRRKSLLELPSLLWVISGRIRLGNLVWRTRRI